MTITVSESTPRPLIEESFVVDIISGQNPHLKLTSDLKKYSNEELATEYCARFFGNGTYEITISGEELYA